MTHHACALVPRTHHSFASPRPTPPWFHTHNSIYWLMLSTWKPHYGRGHALCWKIKSFSVSVPLQPSSQFCEEAWWLEARSPLAWPSALQPCVLTVPPGVRGITEMAQVFAFTGRKTGREIKVILEQSRDMI